MTMQIRYPLAAAALAGCVLAGSAALAQGKPPDARKLYMEKCAACHGKAGKPAPMFANIGVKNLSDPEWQ